MYEEVRKLYSALSYLLYHSVVLYLSCYITVQFSILLAMTWYSQDIVFMVRCSIRSRKNRLRSDHGEPGCENQRFFSNILIMIFFNVCALQLVKFFHILVLQDDNFRNKMKNEKRWQTRKPARNLFLFINQPMLSLRPHLLLLNLFIH